MRRRRRHDYLALALLVSLAPLAALGVGLVQLSEAWRAWQPTPTPPVLEPERGWREWDRGLATWYDGPTNIMRNGEELDLAGLTCAVDASVWPDLKGKIVRVRRQGQDGEGVILRVTDSGYLRSAGRFIWDPVRQRFIPSLFLGFGHHVVVDIPRDTHHRLFGGHTMPVILEVLEDTPEPPR